MPELRSDIAGGQTTDFGGVEVSCPVIDSEPISAGAARAKGFPIDADLPFLQGRSEAQWQRRLSDCADARASSGTLVFQAELAGIYLERHEVESAQCPDSLTYVVHLGLSSSDGLIAGSIEVRGTARSGELLMGGQADARSFAGWLGIRVDRARPHSSKLQVTFAARSGELAGSLYTQVSYTDGGEPPLHTGEVIYWPPLSGDLPCDASTDEPTQAVELIALDDYLSSD